MIKLSKQKKKLIKSDGDLLIIGGPGSGKTTIALLKAKHEVNSNDIENSQKILFLSFARATVSRVEERLTGLKITKDEKSQIEINTYHGFAWEILKSHGYLLNGIKSTKLLTPAEASSKLAEYTDKVEIGNEKERLFAEEGLLHFDLFAQKCSLLFEHSQTLTNIYCDTYPIIILDEFQDTNSSEWKLIKKLGEKSRIIALADAEQRIYDFRGADPKRISEFTSEFHPEVFDFGTENNRSDGTDILTFGNDLLSGKIKREYKNVKIIKYQFRRGGNPHIQMKQAVLASINRLNKKSRDWSLAILVPTKQLMLQVSDCLSKKQRFKNNKVVPMINHEVTLEKEALALSAILIAGLIEKGEAKLEITNRLISNLIEHIRGRKGIGKITQNDLKLSNALQQYLVTGKIRGKNRVNIVQECIRISHECSDIEFTGDPALDWISVRELILKSSSDIVKQVGQDAFYLRLLHKGSLLQSGLAGLWREKTNYQGAFGLVRNALLQEHFSTLKIVPKGVQVMTIHKAKGKEFNEVIIYEGLFNGRIVRNPNNNGDVHKSKLLLRVAVTRAIENTTILTPSMDCCMLLR